MCSLKNDLRLAIIPSVIKRHGFYFHQYELEKFSFAVCVLLRNRIFWKELQRNMFELRPNCVMTVVTTLFLLTTKWPVWLLYGNQSIHFHCKTTRPISIWRGHVMLLRSGSFDFMMLRNFNRSFYTATRPLLCIGKKLTGFYVKRAQWC